jgi:hypothetical protein
LGQSPCRGDAKRPSRVSRSATNREEASLQRRKVCAQSNAAPAHLLSSATVFCCRHDNEWSRPNRILDQWPVFRWSRNQLVPRLPECLHTQRPAVNRNWAEPTSTEEGCLVIASSPENSKSMQGTEQSLGKRPGTLAAGPAMACHSRGDAPLISNATQGILRGQVNRSSMHLDRTPSELVWRRPIGGTT